jgi:hypothetical protein
MEPKAVHFEDVSLKAIVAIKNVNGDYCNVEFVFDVDDHFHCHTYVLFCDPARGDSNPVHLSCYVALEDPTVDDS